ncbi:hypothetical protein MNBD_BACTEROID01-1311 [hydrothermal vent metagenome]|uniref:ATP synthase protein I2 n=1 Tax=hydrothermal vent metagenome TaxID=652676 RepID=A0A3B0TFC9_9ZZZZ
MSPEFKKFLLKLIAATIILALLGWVVFFFIFRGLYMGIYPVALVFFSTFTLLVHAYQLKLARGNLAKFTRSNMLVTFVKLVVYSLFTVIYLAANTENAVVFVIVVMALYLVFTSLEVSDLVKIARTQNKNK